uniref:Peptidase A1 domain-containing protein n=3 Tax=Aegilops tauschii subsp. strangulata TaxID=200361 RepID=A0A453PFF9_AEGTS
PTMAGSQRERSKDRSAKKLLLLLLCGYHAVVARAWNNPHGYKVAAIGSRKAEAVCSVTPSSSSGATVPLNHRHGPCSPAPSAKAPTILELLQHDQLRAKYIKQKLSGTAGLQPLDLTVPTTLGSALNTLEYVITVGIGSPAVTQTMMIDTGSDVSWVRCNSTDGVTLFDPSKSTTYAPFSCSSAACAQLGTQGNNCSSSGCQYSVQYFDGSNTTGTYGSDTLALSDADTVTDFHFGCSYHEEEMDEEKFDGLMGLGGDVPSLVSQTAATYGKSFSYCLPPTNSTSGFLTFGAPNGTSGFVTTPMLRYTQAPTFYGVLLKDISVGGTPLRIQSSVFSGGSVMDSGTVITWLPRRAYSALSSAFRSGMRRYPRAAPVGILDTCYDFTGLSNVSVPTVELVFDGGAVMDLDSDGIMIEHCLAFAPTSDESFIGNVQQRTFEVLHDVGQGIFGFRSGTC